MGDDGHVEPDIPMSSTCRRFTPRSGFEFLSAISGRSDAAVRWIGLRVLQLTGLGWGFRGIKTVLQQECDRQPWKNNLTDYDEGEI